MHPDTPEPRPRCQDSELSDTAFFAAEVDEHPQVHFGPQRLAVSADLLHHEDRGLRPGRFLAALENPHSRFVGPVVEDRRKQVAIRAGQRIEEAARYDVRAVAESCRLESLARRLTGSRLIGYRAPEGGMRCQQGNEQRTVAPADIDHMLERSPVIR